MKTKSFFLVRGIFSRWLVCAFAISTLSAQGPSFSLRRIELAPWLESFTLKWDSRPGGMYRVMVTDHPSDGWELLKDQIGATGRSAASTHVNEIPEGGVRFYRIEHLPAMETTVDNIDAESSGFLTSSERSGHHDDNYAAGLTDTTVSRWMRWRPNLVEGLYKIEIRRPSGTTGWSTQAPFTVHDSTGTPTTYPIDFSVSTAEWIELENPHAFLKGVGGYVELTNQAPGSVVIGDAVRFTRVGDFPETPRKPNIVLILTDDQGYGDVGVYGAQGFETPQLDQMAAEGVRFTDFYVASSVCSPSRAALMTGSYPQRVGIPGVLGYWTDIGINETELLLPEMLREQGYATALVGKWHLGHRDKFFPRRHGFDEFFGTLWSNDLGPKPASLEERRLGLAGLRLWENETVLEVNPDQRLLTRRYTEKATDFIRRHREEPFFLYLAHNMPHTPLFASEGYEGTTSKGLYGDVIAELDGSVGEVLDTIREEGLSEETLVIFLSDNGPWLIFGDHGGSAGPLQGGKRQTLEGGQRVPCIMWWPGTIPQGRVNSEFATAMDFFPTLAELSGGRLPDHPIDGHPITSLMLNEPGAATPYEVFYYYHVKSLQALRVGKWKLQLPHQDIGAPDPDQIGQGGTRGQTRTVTRGLALYDLSTDSGERYNVAGQHPEVVAELLERVDWARRELGDSNTGDEGQSIRPPGR